MTSASTVSLTQRQAPPSTQLREILTTVSSQIQLTVKWLQEAEQRIREEVEEAERLEERIRIEVEERVRKELAKRIGSNNEENLSEQSRTSPSRSSIEDIIATDRAVSFSPEVLENKGKKAGRLNFFNTRVRPNRANSGTDCYPLELVEVKSQLGSVRTDVKPPAEGAKLDPVNLKKSEGKSQSSGSKPEEKHIRPDPLNVLPSDILSETFDLLLIKDDETCTSDIFDSFVSEMTPQLKQNQLPKQSEERDLTQRPLVNSTGNSIVSSRVKAARQAMDHVTRVTSARSRRKEEQSVATPPRLNNPTEEGNPEINQESLDLVEENREFQIPTEFRLSDEEIPEKEVHQQKDAQNMVCQLEWECEKCSGANPMNFQVCGQCSAVKPSLVVLKPAKTLVKAKSNSKLSKSNKENNNIESSTANLTEDKPVGKRKRNSKELSKSLFRSRSTSVLAFDQSVINPRKKKGNQGDQ